MYLSQLILNIRSPEVVRDQSNPYEMHRTIMRAFSLFDHQQERTLFRLEGEYLHKLLVQSTLKPDWNVLINKGSYLTEMPAMKTFDSFPFAKGQLLRFKLRANPVKRDRVSRKRVPLLNDTERIAWMIRKGAESGFTPDENTMSCTSSTWCQFAVPGEKRQTRATLNIVDFQGILRVEDVELLNSAIRNGIGPAKGLGCGMLTLARS